MAPKTAVSLPRKLNNSYAHNLTVFQGGGGGGVSQQHAATGGHGVGSKGGKQNRMQNHVTNLNVT